MRATDRQLQDWGDTLTRRTGLQHVPEKLDTPGLYLVNRSQGRDWVLTIYAKPKLQFNDIEIAFDHRGVSNQYEESRAARAWFEELMTELNATESGVHAPRPIDALRKGLSIEQTSEMVERFAQRLRDRSVARWSRPAAHASQGTQFPDVATLMLQTVKQTVAQSGQVSMVTAKIKEFRFNSDEAFLQYVRDLLTQCAGRCTLTGVTFEAGNPDFSPSLDRIDSDGHYEPGNLQVVARFANRWKSDQPNDEFRRLLAAVRAVMN